MGRRAPRAASEAVRAVRDSIAPATPLAGVQRVWAEVAGQGIAAVAEPVAERQGAVVIGCSSAVWAEELDLMQEQLLDRLRERLDSQAPDALRFEVREAG